jgi:histidine ammonia-lyase
VLAIEVNAVSDNPIVLPEDDEVRSGGNFHGMPVAIAMDALALALVSLASISDRRLYRLLDAKTSNGLPPFLVAESGLNSGFMLVQYTAVARLECKTLAHRVRGLDPSSAGQEDREHGTASARHAREVVTNAEIVLTRGDGRGAGADRARPFPPGATTAVRDESGRRWRSSSAAGSSVGIETGGSSYERAAG